MDQHTHLPPLPLQPAGASAAKLGPAISSTNIKSSTYKWARPRTFFRLLFCLPAQARRTIRLVLLRCPRHLSQPPPLLLLCVAMCNRRGRLLRRAQLARGGVQKLQLASWPGAVASPPRPNTCTSDRRHSCQASMRERQDSAAPAVCSQGGTPACPRPALPASHTAPKQGAPVSFPVRYSLRWYRCAAFSRSSASLRAAASSRRRRVASAKSLQQAGQHSDTSGQDAAAEAAVRGTDCYKRQQVAWAQSPQSSESAAGAGSKPTAGRKTCSRLPLPKQAPGQDTAQHGTARAAQHAQRSVARQSAHLRSARRASSGTWLAQLMPY